MKLTFVLVIVLMLKIVFVNEVIVLVLKFVFVNEVVVLMFKL